MSFSVSKIVDSKKVFLTSSAHLEQRWDPNYYRCMAVFRAKLKHCSHPIQRLKPSLGMVQYGISERATEEPIGVPMLRMINLQSDTWDLSDMKYIAMTDEQKKPYLIQQGDILFNRTNSKELVGKCNVVNFPGEYVFASYLIRVRLKQGTLLPDYVTAYLASPLGRIQIDAVSRQIAGMTNINAEEIRDLYIPVPARPIQEAVAEAWRNAIRRRDKTLESARAILSWVDTVLLDELAIQEKPAPANTVANRIYRRSLSEVTGWRLDPIANQEKRRVLVRAINSGRYPVRPLHQIVSVQKKLVDTISPGVTYVGLENIDGQTGEYTSTQEKESVGTAIEFHQGQILFPKLRPYLNKTHLATFDGICSTEFHVFTPAGIRGDYLAEFLRSRAIVGITSLLMTGNTLPRLQMADIERLPIPIPPPQVQGKICAAIKKTMDEAAVLRAKAASELETAKEAIEGIIIGGAGA